MNGKGSTKIKIVARYFYNVVYEQVGGMLLKRASLLYYVFQSSEAFYLYSQNSLRGRMDYYSYLNCWQITNCDNLDCPARLEPETPCWEISQRVADFHNISSTCKDCIVYILKEEPSVLEKRDLQLIIEQKNLLKHTGANQKACILEGANASEKCL